MLVKIILSFSFVAFATDVSAVIGGRWALPNEFPYQVALKNSSDYYFCGGVILNSRWILTINRCLDEAKDIVVQTGSRYLDGETERKAQRIPVHEKKLLSKYESNPREWEPALLKLDKPLEMNEFVKAISLPTNSKIEYKQKVTFAGWGPTLSGESGQSNILKVANTTTGECLFPNSFCANSYDGNACIKDYGSPVVSMKNGKSVVIGLVSDLDLLPCGRADGWFRATMVGLYLDEIKNVIGENPSEEASTKVEIDQSKTPFTNCPSEYSIYNLSITGCTSSPCIIYKGTSPRIEFDFFVQRDTTELKPRVYSTSYDMMLAFPQENACQGLKNSKCPLKKGQRATYSFGMPVPEDLYTVRSDIQIWFTDQDEYVVFCFGISVDIRNRAER